MDLHKHMWLKFMRKRSQNRFKSPASSFTSHKYPSNFQMLDAFNLKLHDVKIHMKTILEKSEIAGAFQTNFQS